MQLKKFINILIVILILFESFTIILPTSSGQPAGILYQVPVYINNTQSSATPGPFQQIVKIPISQFSSYLYDNNTTANFEFYYANNTIIPSWIESVNGTTIVVWLKLYSIPASTQITIYLGFASKSINLLSSSGTTGIGEAPQLSPTYAQYDDGVSVFSFYDNFAGTTLNTSKWTSYYNSYITVNNGITFGSGGLCFIETNTKYSISNIVEMYINSGMYSDSGIMYVVDVNGNVYTNANYGQWIAIGTATGQAYNGLEGDARSTYALTSFNSGSHSIVAYSYPNAPLIMGIVVPNSANGYLYVNEVPVTTNTQNVPPQGNYYITLGGYQSNLNVYYVRVRAYPPSGVMPTVSIGSIAWFF